MPLAYACIAPHGGELIPSLAGKKAVQFTLTRNAMRVLAAEIKKARPDTIVVASPHNLRLLKHIGVMVSEYTSGKVREGKHEVRLRAKCDVEFARRVVEVAERRGLPVVAANFGALEGPMSDLAMDWGTLIPLWFLLRGTGLRSKVVVVTPSRGIPLRQNFEFGEALGEAAKSDRKRVAFVASADQAHAHRRDGPYGFDRRAAEYDRLVAEAVKQDRLESVMEFPASLVEGAKPDSLWQMAILAGALSVAPMRGKLVSYQAPTYFGMLCASYSR